jgi:hypothetical protein
MRESIDPIILARLLRVPQREIAARLDVSSAWCRMLSRDPKHTRRLTIAVLEAAVERLRLEEAMR